MDNDKVFAAYALTLTLGVCAALAYAVNAGFATIPTPVVAFEHLAMSFGMRFAYKSIGGIDASDWNIFGSSRRHEVVDEVPLSVSGFTADATS